jgi:biopolymer transport protein ExbD
VSAVFHPDGKEDDMAGVDVGEAGGCKRATNSDINMVPFIDLLLTTIAFLLITAVWVTNSRIAADAQVPGQDTCKEERCETQTDKVLHVNVGESDFELVWKQAGTVVSQIHVPRAPFAAGTPDAQVVRYPELARAITKEWSERGTHRDPSDRKPDQAVLHTDNRTPFKELVAVLDALNNTQRDLKLPDGKTAKIPAFNPTFAVR